MIIKSYIGFESFDGLQESSTGSPLMTNDIERLNFAAATAQRRPTFAGIEFEISLHKDEQSCEECYDVSYAVVTDEGSAFVELHAFSETYCLSRFTDPSSVEFSNFCSSDPESDLEDALCLRVPSQLLSCIKDTLIGWLETWIQTNPSAKLLAIGMCKQCAPSFRFQSDFCSEVWNRFDIIPSVFDTLGDTLEERAQSGLRKALSLFGPIAGSPKIELNPYNRVLVSANNSILLASVKAYESLWAEKWRDERKRAFLVDSLQDKRILFFNSTPQGGGVALMRHAMCRLYYQLGLPLIHWYVMRPSPKAFMVTKFKVHNVLQSASHEMLTDNDTKTYEDWILRNVTNYWKKELFSKADIIVLDDPQVAGLFPHIRKANPRCKVVYRSHIQIHSDLVSTEGSAQQKVWQWLWSYIKDVDAFVAHPIKAFVPEHPPIDKNKIFYWGASTDPLDGLNKPLQTSDLVYYMEMFKKIATDQHQCTPEKPLHLGRRFFLQIARFDPSKGIPDLIEVYRVFRVRLQELLQQKNEPISENAIPILIICGNGAIDDPDGSRIVEEIKTLLQESRYADVWKDIFVVRLPPYDQMLNALLQLCHIYFQFSSAEGYEVKITEALLKGKPTIVRNVGGMPLQVQHAKTGFVANGDSAADAIKEAADWAFELFTDRGLYMRMAKDAQAYYDKMALTPNDAFEALQFFYDLLNFK